MPTPGYPCYRNVLRALEVEVVDIPVGPETRFQPSPSDLEAVGPLQGLVVASPSNPTGTMLLEEELLDLVSCRSPKKSGLSLTRFITGSPMEIPPPLRHHIGRSGSCE